MEMGAGEPAGDGILPVGAGILSGVSSPQLRRLLFRLALFGQTEEHVSKLLHPQPMSRQVASHHHSSSISFLSHSRVTFNLEWCDQIKLSDALMPRKSGTIKSLQQLSTSGTVLALEQFAIVVVGAQASSGWVE